MIQAVYFQGSCSKKLRFSFSCIFVVVVVFVARDSNGYRQEQRGDVNNSVSFFIDFNG